MKVILLQDVKSLGKKGQVLEVAEGYGRNFLLPRKLAQPATDSSVNESILAQAAKACKEQQQLDESRLLAGQLKDVVVKVPVKVGEEGRMFGTVTAQDVADKLKADNGFEIEKRKIDLKDHIKTLGTYTATLKLHTEVSVKIEVQVVPE